MIQISRNSARAYTTFIQSLYYKVYITSKIANRQRLEVLREASRRLPAFEHADSDRNRKFSRETLKVQKETKQNVSFNKCKVKECKFTLLFGQWKARQSRIPLEFFQKKFLLEAARLRNDKHSRDKHDLYRIVWFREWRSSTRSTPKQND